MSSPSSPHSQSPVPLPPSPERPGWPLLFLGGTVTLHFCRSLPQGTTTPQKNLQGTYDPVKLTHFLANGFLVATAGGKGPGSILFSGVLRIEALAEGVNGVRVAERAPRRSLHHGARASRLPSRPPPAAPHPHLPSCGELGKCLGPETGTMDLDRLQACSHLPGFPVPGVPRSPAAHAPAPPPGPTLPSPSQVPAVGTAAAATAPPTPGGSPWGL